MERIPTVNKTHREVTLADDHLLYRIGPGETIIVLPGCYKTGGEPFNVSPGAFLTIPQPKPDPSVK